MKSSFYLFEIAAMMLRLQIERIQEAHRITRVRRNEIQHYMRLLAEMGTFRSLPAVYSYANVDPKDKTSNDQSRIHNLKIEIEECNVRLRQLENELVDNQQDYRRQLMSQ
jgi:hypothetical protein